PEERRLSREDSGPLKDLGGVVPVLIAGHVLGRGDHLDVVVRPFSDCRSRLVHASLTVRLGGEKVADTNQITQVTGFLAAHPLRQSQLGLFGLREAGRMRGVRTLHGAPPPSDSKSLPENTGAGNRWSART